MPFSPWMPLLAAGEPLETTWKLQTHWGWAPWLTVLLLTAAVVLVIACYRSEVSPARTLYRALLTGLRLTTIGLLLLMLSEAVFSGVQTGRPRLAILLDRSESMQLTDVTDPEKGARTTRENAARDVLLRNNGQLVNTLAEQYDLELLLVDSAWVEGGNQGSEVLSTLAQPDATTDRSATRLGDALAALVENPLGSPLQGVLALTDGQTTEGRSLNDAAEAARQRGVPLYLLGIGSEVPPPKAELEGLLADDTVFVGDLVRFRATLRTSGLAGRGVRVALLRDGQTVAEEIVTTEGDQETLPVQLLDRPSTEGRFPYTLRATLEGEADTPLELPHMLTVREGKIRVLLAAGYPNYEYRYLKQLLERDTTVEVASFLQESDPEYAASDFTALRRFPVTEEELDAYDALVLIDLDPTLLPRLLWSNVARFVGQQGGGLALVAGPRSLPTAYVGRQAFAALMPTKISPGMPGGWADPKGFRPRLTPLGLQSATMLLDDTPTTSEQVWQGLEPHYWLADVGPPKPSARVLTEHAGLLATAGTQAPLMVTQYYGAGRVLLHAVDSTWRWRRKVGDTYFARYWVQTLRSLSRGKQSMAGEAELTTTAPRYELGEPVRLLLHDRKRTDNTATAPTLLVSSANGEEHRVALEPTVGGQGRFQAKLQGLSPGKYRAVLVTGETRTVPLAVGFEILAPPGELAHTEMNRAALTAAAERTRGEFLTLDQADRLAEVLPQGRPVPIDTLPPIELWNRWPVLLAICCSLCAEWILRKRRSML